MTIPDESAEYRKARNQLLKAEAELRAKTEEVAALRRKLPVGAAPREDYEFTDVDGDPVLLSQLFADGQNSLFLYNFMFAPTMGQGACSMCVAFLDSLDGAAPHIGDRVSVAVAAKASPEELKAFAANRGWRNLRLISAAGNNYNADYGAEAPDGSQLPMAHVWRRTPTGTRHFWSSELFSYSSDWPNHPRHVDAMWPLWNVFDVMPEGRGDVWYPKLAY